MPTLSSLMKDAEDAASSMYAETTSEAERLAKLEAKGATFAQIMAANNKKAEQALIAQQHIQQLLFPPTSGAQND